MANARHIELFDEICSEEISAFPVNKLLRRIECNQINLGHYHAILTTLFHQTRSSPYTFARAAANCDWKHETAKEYLLRHAEEERTHWRWILDDLRNTGYVGADPRDALPHPTCQAYIAINHLVADSAPIARLAIAAVLEGIGATHGTKYGRLLLQHLGLDKSKATFFLSHGETDVGHSKDLRAVILQCSLSEFEWNWMHQATRCAGKFYRAMYDHSDFE